MFKNFDVAAAFVRESRIRMIDLKFSDLWGRWHHVTLSASEFAPGLMTAGIGWSARTHTKCSCILTCRGGLRSPLLEYRRS